MYFANTSYGLKLNRIEESRLIDNKFFHKIWDITFFIFVTLNCLCSLFILCIFKSEIQTYFFRDSERNSPSNHGDCIRTESLS